MVGTRRLKELVAGAVAHLDLPEGPLTIGLSGGADSAALAFLVIEGDLPASALHINHSLPASPKMETAARDIAASLDVELDIVTVDVAPGPSPEDKARLARYEAFSHIAGPVLTAHTKDDVAETVLINLIRGTGATGLAGIPYHRTPNVYRPALGVSRSETRELATLAKLPFVDDPMNQDMSLTRNRIRHRILPEISELNPDVVSAIARAASALRSDVDLLAELTPAPGPHLVVSEVVTAPPAIADRLIGRWLEQAGLQRSADMVRRVRTVVEDGAPRQDLGGGRAAVRRDALIVIE